MHDEDRAVRDEDRAPRDEDTPDLAPTRRTHFVAPDASVPPQAPLPDLIFKFRTSRLSERLASIGVASRTVMSSRYYLRTLGMHSQELVMSLWGLEIYSWTLGMCIDVGIGAARIVSGDQRQTMQSA